MPEVRHLADPADKKYARELFDHAIEVAPKLAVAYWCSGNLYRTQGEYELAGRAYEQAVEIAPEDEQARKKLAEWRSFIAEVRKDKRGRVSN